MRCKGGAKAKDETGKTYGRLTVLRRAEKSRGDYQDWICICICGKEHQVAGAWLRSGASRSCGCLQKENIKKASAAKLALPRKPEKPRKPRIIPPHLHKRAQRPLRPLPPNLAAAHAASKARKVKIMVPGMFSAKIDRPRIQGVKAGRASASMFGQPEILRNRREELRLLMQRTTEQYVERMRHN